MKLRAWLLGVLLLAVCGYAVAEFTVGPGGLYIADGTPSSSDNKLYSVAGALYWDGVAVGSGGGFACTGTDNKWAIPTTNTQAAVQAAINTTNPVYLPPGTYTISSGLTIATAGQIISGAGVGRTILYVSSGFAGTGALIINAVSVTVRDLTIRFYQPLTFSARSELNGYSAGSAAIYASGRTGLRLYDLELDMVYNGMKLLSNCGQTEAANVRITHFNRGIELSNVLDITRFSNINFDDASLTGTQLALFKNAATYGFCFGRSDDVMIQSSRFSCGTGIYMYAGPDVGYGVAPVASVVSSFFDNANGIQITAGQLSVTGCRFNLTSYAAKGIYQVTGGSTLLVTGCSFSNSYSGAISLDLDGGSSTTSVNGCYFYGSVNQDEVYIHATGNYTINGCTFERSASYATGAVVQSGSGAKLTFVGNRFTPASCGTSVTLGSTDIGHVVCGNCFNGWTTPTVSGIDKAGQNN